MKGPIEVFVPERAIDHDRVWVEVGTELTKGHGGNRYSVTIPPHVESDSFAAGWRHAWQGQQLSKAPHFRRSFREGYRAAKFAIRKMRSSYGIPAFPQRMQFKIRAQ